MEVNNKSKEKAWWFTALKYAIWAIFLIVVADSVIDRYTWDEINSYGAIVILGWLAFRSLNTKLNSIDKRITALLKQ